MIQPEPRNLSPDFRYIGPMAVPPNRRYQAGRFASWIGATGRMPMNLVRLYAEFSGTLTPEFDAIRTKA